LISLGALLLGALVDFLLLLLPLLLLISVVSVLSPPVRVAGGKSIDQSIIIMKFSGFSFLFAVATTSTPWGVVSSHPNANALTREEIDSARSIFRQFKADPSNPDVLLHNPELLETLQSMFGGIFDRDELMAILLDIFYTDESDEVAEVAEAAVTGDDESSGGEIDDHTHSPITEKGKKQQVSSDMLSDAPSLVPSDAPSFVPSDMPSTLPSDAPSSTPFFYADLTDPTDIDIPKGFRGCPKQVGTSADMKKAPKLTIMYGYRLELEDDAKMNDVIKAVEDKVTAHLLDSICGPDQAMAVSSGPMDTPGGE
jgi:hypothetical protein